MNCGCLVVAVWLATDQASGAAAVGSGAVPARRDLLQHRPTVAVHFAQQGN